MIRRHCCTAIFRSTLNIEHQSLRQEAKDEGERIGQLLREAAIQEGHVCTELDDWRDSGWSFLIKNEEEIRRPVDCIICPVESLLGDFVACLSVQPSWTWFFHPPKLEFLHSIVRSVDEWLREMDAKEIRWALEIAPNFANVDRWTSNVDELLH